MDEPNARSFIKQSIFAIIVAAALVAIVACGGGGDDQAVVAPSESPNLTLTPRLESTPTPTPVATAVVLNTSAQNLITLADLPSGWSREDSDPGSAIADSSTYSACGPGPTVPLDVGFYLTIHSPFAGQTITQYSSADEASKGLGKAATRVKSCTENDNVGTTTSIKVSTQSFASYGDEIAAFRVELVSSSSTGVGYVVLVRKSNLVITIFYLDFKGNEGLTLLDTLTATAVGRLGTS